MANVSISIPDQLLATTLAEAVKGNVSFEAFVEQALRVAIQHPANDVCPVIDLQSMLAAAVSAAKEITKGETFLLKDLCRAEEWVCVTPGDRKVFGKRFRKALEGQGIARFFDRTTNNQAIYRRI